MREAVSLMGGYGITEDCPGFLGHKWMDAQLEATYEGPEAVQRRQLSVTMTDELFLAQFRKWIREMRLIANDRPGTGACALATAMQMWLWSLQHLLQSEGCRWRQALSERPPGRHLPAGRRAVLAARPRAARFWTCWSWKRRAPQTPPSPKGLPGLLAFLTDLCHVQSARAAGEVGRICAELVFGYNRHPAWDTEGCSGCYQADELEAMESLIPGISSLARGYTDVIETDGAPSAQGRPLRRASTGWTSSPACACAWMAASPARSLPRTAPPKP